MILLLISQIAIVNNAISETHTNIETIETSFQISSYQIEEKNDYLTINLNEESSILYHPGKPNLPVITKTFILPFTTKIEEINVESSESKYIKIEKPIIPCDQPKPVGELSELSSDIIFNDEIYQKSDYYPETNYKLTSGAGLKDGEHVNYVTIHWYPIQYNPGNNLLKISENIDIKLLYSTPTQPIIFPDEYDLTIIAPQSFEQSIQSLIDHKNQNNVKTFFKSVESISQTYEGRDLEEQIKYFIKESVEIYGIEYVLFIGDVDLTPLRSSAIHVHHDNDLLTDLYYADIYNADGSFSTWDTNNNNKFSEYNWDQGLIDDVDAYADIYVGRIPSSTTQEVDVCVDKIITYETQAAAQTWFNKILLMAGDTFPNHGVIEGEVVTEIVSNYMQIQNFESIKLWTSEGDFKPMKINREINKGIGFISYSGHGYELGFGTSPPNGQKRIEYFSPNLLGMNNKDKLPVFFFDACSTTKLDFTVEDLHEWYSPPISILFCLLEKIPYQQDHLYPCFSWQLMKKTNGGTIGTIGATRVAYTGVDASGPHWGASLLNTNFFKAYEPGKTLGELMVSTQIDYVNTVGKECITLEEFILLGDPSLQLGGFS
jgi:hypothetical protein